PAASGPRWLCDNLHLHGSLLTIEISAAWSPLGSRSGRTSSGFHGPAEQTDPQSSLTSHRTSGPLPQENTRAGRLPGRSPPGFLLSAKFPAEEPERYAFRQSRRAARRDSLLHHLFDPNVCSRAAD